MATDLVTINTQLPAHLIDQMGQPSSVSADMTSGIGSSDFKRISIRGSRFRIREGANETVLPDTKLRAIIVGATPNVTKRFYKDAYNPKAEEKGPDCYSNDGIRPANDSPDIQAQLCATCEHNQWGSKTSDTGSKMKRCADQKQLAIISADDEKDEPELYQFTVTPAALTNFRNYGQLLASKAYPVEMVVTELSFDTSEAYPKVQFKFGGFIDEQKLPVVKRLVDSDEVNAITGKTAQVAKVEEAPKKSPIKKKEPEYVPPPTDVEYAEFEEVAPPPKKTGFGAAPKQAPVVEVPAAPAVVQSSKLTDDINDILKKMEEEND